VRTDDRLGSYDDVVAQAPAHAATLAALRALAHAAHPDGVETASTRERSVSWGFDGGKKTHWWGYMMPHAAHVNLGFFHGVALPDPAGRLEGTGARLRHVKLRAPTDAGDPAIRDLIHAAVAERRAALTPKE